MDPLIILGAAFGGLITWVVCKYFYDERRRLYLRETTDQMKQSMEIQHRFYSVTAMCYLDALKTLEKGDVKNAKHILAFGTANFHRQFAGPSHSDFIQRTKRDIEIHAKKSEELKAALENNERDSCLTDLQGI